jgi:hypothetical protein
MNNVRRRLPVFFVAAVAMAAVLVWRSARANGGPTQTPIIAYSGTLLNGGQPVTTAQTLGLILWDVATGGTSTDQQCIITPQSVTPDQYGRFRIALDSCVAAFHANTDLWAELSISGSPLSPRTKVGAVAYALEADHATTATSIAITTQTGSATGNSNTGVCSATASCPAGQTPISTNCTGFTSTGSPMLVSFTNGTCTYGCAGGICWDAVGNVCNAAVVCISQ